MNRPCFPKLKVSVFFAAGKPPVYRTRATDILALDYASSETIVTDCVLLLSSTLSISLQILCKKERFRVQYQPCENIGINIVSICRFRFEFNRCDLSRKSAPVVGRGSWSSSSEEHHGMYVILKMWYSVYTSAWLVFRPICL